jgi:hypothetical protein
MCKSTTSTPSSWLAIHLGHWVPPSWENQGKTYNNIFCYVCLMGKVQKCKLMIQIEEQV